MENLKYPYEKPRKIAENLWEVRGSWSNKLGRRMTIIRIEGKKLIVHSAIALEEAELAWLKGLGELVAIVAPNTFHCSEAAWMKEKFPAAELYVPAEKLKEFERFSAKDVNQDFPLVAEFVCVPMKGSKMQEAAFIHLPSRTLILCDLAFHMGEVFTGIGKIFAKWNRIHGRFGPSKLTKVLFTSNRDALLASYEKLLAFDFDRVVVNHGEVLESGGKERLKKAVEEIWSIS